MRLAQAGVRVTVLEARDTPGGGTRTEELTLPGFRHDVCSAIHPLGAASPFFNRLLLQSHGLRWIQPDVALAHPFDDGSALTIDRSVRTTAAGFGKDGAAYRRLFEPFVSRWNVIGPAILGPALRAPSNPLLLARFGFSALQSATGLGRRTFDDPKTQAIFAGVAAHSNTPIDAPFSAGIAMALIAGGHAAGWPIAAGGSASITAALAAELRTLGGTIETSRAVESMDEVRGADAVLFDLGPRQISRSQETS